MAQDNAVAQVSALLNGTPSGKEEALPTEQAVEDDELQEDEDHGREAIISEDADEEELEEGDEEGGDEGDDERPMTLKQLAEAIEVDVDYLYEIEIGMGDNQDPIPVGKLKDVYQEAIRNNTQLQEKLTSQAAEYEQKNLGAQQNRQVSEQGQAAEYEIRDVEQKFREIDWDRFEAESPGQAALARQKFMERHQTARQTLQHVSQQEKANDDEYMQQMGVKLNELIPTWSDPAVRSKEQGQIRELLSGMGFTQEMINGVRDPLAISVVHRLVKAEAKLAGGAAEVKRVRSAPKVLRHNNGRFKQKEDQTIIDTKKAVSANRNRHTELAAAKAIFNKRR